MEVINNVASSFGVIPLAIISVLIRAGRFIQMPILGLGQGTMPVRCTEIPLLFDPDDCPLPTLDSTCLLARAALKEALRQD